jgi:hypothetical protein
MADSNECVCHEVNSARASTIRSRSHHEGCMGIQLQSKQEIAGFPVLKIRNLLRSIGEGSIRKEWLIEKGFSQQEARLLFEALVQNEYIEPDLDATPHIDNGPFYKLTEQGHSTYPRQFPTARPLIDSNGTRTDDQQPRDPIGRRHRNGARESGDRPSLIRGRKPTLVCQIISTEGCQITR